MEALLCALTGETSGYQPSAFNSGYNGALELGNLGHVWSVFDCRGDWGTVLLMRAGRWCRAGLLAPQQHVGQS